MSDWWHPDAWNFEQRCRKQSMRFIHWSLQSCCFSEMMGRKTWKKSHIISIKVIYVDGFLMPNLWMVLSCFYLWNSILLIPRPVPRSLGRAKNRYFPISVCKRKLPWPAGQDLSQFSPHAKLVLAPKELLCCRRASKGSRSSLAQGAGGCRKGTQFEPKQNNTEPYEKA